MSQYDELKRLAEAALNELTEINQDWPTDGDYFDCQSGPEFEYLCAANPVVVMTLIAENQQLRTDRDYCRRVAEHNKEVGEQLRAEIAGLKTGYQAYEQVNAELKAENEALRKDAERYQWMSIEGNWVARFHGKWRAHVGEYGDANPTDWYPSRAEAIDAAMGKGEQS
jgi:hypothetical protein